MFPHCLCHGSVCVCVCVCRQLVSSRVSYYRHPVVALQFFETVARYDKFFNIEAEFVPDVLVSEMS